MKTIHHLVAAFFMLLSVGALAQELPTASSHWKIVEYQNTVNIHDDLSHTWDMHLALEALSDNGANEIGHYSKSYNRDLETMTLVEAYTLKANGKKIPIEANGVQTQVGVASGNNGISWPNVNVVQLTFPDVQKGDRTVIHFSGTVQQYPLPGWLQMQEYLNPAYTWENFSYTVQAPASQSIQLIAQGLSVQRSENAGQITWKVTGKYPPKTTDSRVANWQTSVPRLSISSFAKHEQLAAAYSAENRKKVVVDAQIQQLAADITKGHTSPYAQAQALYDWVRNNVRYVAAFIGTGGYVPHDVSTILKNRYGDCKDHQLLFQTLLQAAGIDAVPALINATSAQFELLDLPVGFDHVITYIPSLQLFADPTATAIPFGQLPWADADRPVAVGLAQGAQLMRTPAAATNDNSVSSQSVWTIKADGNADLDIGIQTTGYAATEMQNELDQIPAGMSGAAIQQILQQSGWRGQGFAKYAKVQRQQLAQNLNAQIEIRNLLSDPNIGSIAPNPTLALPIYSAANLGIYTEGTREFATLCTPISVTEVFELHFDKGYKISRIPKNVNLNNPDGISFTAQYELANNTLKGRRTLNLTQPRHVCSKEQYAARLPTLMAIAQHLKGNVFFER